MGKPPKGTGRPSRDRVEEVILTESEYAVKAIADKLGLNLKTYDAQSLGTAIIQSPAVLEGRQSAPTAPVRSYALSEKL